MPFVFLVAGLALLLIAWQGTQDTAIGLLKSELSGAGNFVVWFAALAILLALGYIKPIKTLADSMAGLVLLSMFIANKGVFSQFNQQIRNPVPASGATGASGATPSYALRSYSTAPNGSTTMTLQPGYAPSPPVLGVPTTDPYLPTYTPPTA